MVPWKDGTGLSINTLGPRATVFKGTCITFRQTMCQESVSGLRVITGEVLMSACRA